ncbi:MAG TPA: UDP-N-acetylmuramoyl-tripeptide--D-alanyl-D-alanine ligase [Caulobacteraceae bacterium]|nr:UDP-N-acetylmuramoyl-tripeptide--D-alanyl-D-alanine ligase [Caulobacteraceae bacterium]
MTEPLWTSDAIVAATGGKLSGAPFTVDQVSIDSRALEGRDLFVALPGVRDGHDFVAAALAAGAAGALTTRPMDGSCVVVDDTLKALEKLGEAARDRAASARRGAVTGSVGKTSVTQAVRAGLDLAGRAHGSVKSYNNHIGVPLTLARMPAATQRAIFEIGMNHAGEIEPLTRMVRPHAVAITTVGAVHTENFPDGEAGVARAKAEIFAGLQSGGPAILNADDRWFEFLSGEARKAGATIRSFGAAGADARLTGFEAGGAGASVSATIDGRAVRFPLLQSGSHWGPMSLCVLLMLRALDVDLETGIAALGAFTPLAGRGAEREVRIAGGAFTLVDESYNANPISMAATLKTLGARSAKGRRIAALTDMLELGPKAAEYHAGLAAPIEAAKVDLVYCAGPMMKSLWEALPPTRRGGYAEDAAGLAPLVVRTVEPGDVVMVKGSNGSKAQAVAAALAAMDVGSGKGG